VGLKQSEGVNVSNNAQLVVSNEPGEPMTEADWDAESKDEYVNLPIRQSNDTVPVFWQMLFSPENVETYWDEDNEMDTPYLIAPVAEARARFEQRLPEARKAFSNLDDFLPQWMEVLNGISQRYIKVELSEILEMTEGGYDELVPALKFFDELTQEHAIAFMSLSSLSDVYDVESQIISAQADPNVAAPLDYLMGYDHW